jgi:Tfp pilus assembly protein PilF
MFEAARGDTRRARDLFQRNLELHPKHEPTLHSSAELEIVHRRYGAARRLLQRALEVNPRHVHSWTTLARLRYVEGAPAQAREVFVQATQHCGEESGLFAAWSRIEECIGDRSAHR